MNDTFGAGYASAYDLLYGDKDYERECEVLEQTFLRFGDGPIRSVLDLGCGTAGHAIRLARRGYAVTGIDRSDAMLRRAREKAREAGVLVEFERADITGFRVHRRFDAATMMFAVLGYQHENDAVSRALGNARAHLRDGGLVAFDVWYGPAVLLQKPGDRWKMVENGAVRLLRTACARLDVLHHCCDVQYRVWQFDAARVVSETTEEHRVRFFFPQELRLFLDQAGFCLRSLTAFPDLDRAPDESTWNVLAVASAQP